MMPLTNELQESYEKTRICCICQKSFKYKYTNDTNYCKDHCHYTGKYRGAAHSICNLKYSILKEISVAFHSWSNYYYYFIIKEPAKEFEGEFHCGGENTEKSKIFSVSITKEVKMIGEEIANNISYTKQITERMHQIKCKYGHDNKKCETCGIKFKHYDCCLEYGEGNLIEYKCLRITKKKLMKT